MLDVAAGFEVVGNQDAVSVELDRPRVSEVGSGAIVAEDDLGSGGEVGALGVEDAGSDAERGVAVAVGQENAVVGQAEGVERVALKAQLLPGKKRFASVGGTGEAGLVLEFSGPEKSDEVTAGRLDQRGFVE